MTTAAETPDTPTAMVMTEIRASVTVLAFLALAAASGAAQDPAGAAERVLTEFALRELEGDPDAALDAVTSALVQAPPGQRGPLLVRRAQLLRRFGRFDEAREALGELAAVSPRYAQWALAQAAELAVEQDPQDPQKAQSAALERWLIELDAGPHSSNSAAREAYAELRSLGALAVPATVHAMDGFGPDGLANAFELVAPYDDLGIAETVERYLAADQDPIRRVAAADAIQLMPHDVRVRLGSLALRADATRVRLAGAQALVGTGEHTELLVDALGDLLQHRSTAFAAVSLLADESLHGIARIDGWLEAAAFDDQSRVQEKAIAAWFDRHSDTARRVSFFESLTAFGQDLTIRRMTIFSDWRFAEPDLMAAALGCASVDQAEILLPKIPRDALRRSPGCMVALVESLARDADARNDFVASVVQTALELHMTAVTPALVTMLECSSEDKRRIAVRALLDLAPEMVLERCDELLPLFGEDVLLALLDRADPETVPALVRHVRDGSFGGSSTRAGVFGFVGAVSYGQASTPQLAAACEAIGTRSDASNLGVLLELVTVPEPGQRYGDWEARCQVTAMAFGRWFGPAHIAAAMARVDQLDKNVAHLVLELSARHARPEHRAAVLTALERARAGGLEYPRIIPDAQRMLRPIGTGAVAEGCVAILAGIGDPDAVGTLVDLIADPELGGTAVEHLLRIDGFDVRELHERILGDPALWQHAGASFRDPFVAEDPDLRKLAADALRAWPAELWPKEVATLLARVPTDERRELATAILVRMRDGEELQSALATAALFALGDLRDPGLIPVLAIGLEHPEHDVRLQAVQNLQRTFSPDAAPHLIDALKDDSSSVVEAARSALERIESYLEEAQMWRDHFDGLRKDAPAAEEPGTGR